MIQHDRVEKHMADNLQRCLPGAVYKGPNSWTVAFEGEELTLDATRSEATSYDFHMLTFRLDGALLGDFCTACEVAWAVEGVFSEWRKPF